MAKSRKKGTGAPQSAGDATATNPDRQQVAMRAYELFLERGGGDGMAMDDWLLAERELLTLAGAGSRSSRADES